MQNDMETLHEAIERLEARGFRASFRALPGGRVGVRSGRGPRELESFPTREMVVEEVVRFEGQSDPDDEVILFALRSPDDRIRGSLVAHYGSALDAETVAAVEGLRRDPANDRHPGSAEPGR
ncbi:MAG: hypothetical protein ACQGVK_10380 [Myxococcota bacterium]